MNIKFNRAELQSGFDRVRFAEALVLQLPNHHAGRNTWLLNYGLSEEAKALREGRGIQWNPETRSAKTISADQCQLATNTR